MTTRDLLIEIGTEELPPKALLTLSEAFRQEVISQLAAQNLAYSEAEPFATPRRLALLVKDLATKQEDSQVERFGPAVKAAFDGDGNPTKAAQGFAGSCGVSVEELEQKNDGKVDKLYFCSNQPGKDTTELVPAIVDQALAKLPIPKRMRWGSKREEFVRPVHWSIILFGADVIPATPLGAETGKCTYGHRFHAPQAITLEKPTDFEPALEDKGHVIASFSKRRSKIEALLKDKASEIGATVSIDPALLDEVTALVEWPVVLKGNFDPAYLEVPQEALVSSLKEHQKCFHLLDSDDNMLPHFLTVSNLESQDPAQVVAGNERVIGPRLADAAFFFEQDKKQTLESRLEKLRTVVFQKALGTVYDKSQRVSDLSSVIAEAMNANGRLVQRAASLAKCDLITSMVYEFPELQGIMGTYYARADQEDEQVALALFEQYLPRFSGDVLPASEVGLILALAERLDTIAGLFAIGQPPTGSKDPYALRRAALGVIRLILEKELDLDLSALIKEACNLQPVETGDLESLHHEIYSFFLERLRVWYSEQGVSADIFQSVAALSPGNLRHFDLQIRAVTRFCSHDNAEALTAANKRVANILSKVDLPEGSTVKDDLFSENAEKALFEAMNNVSGKVEEACIQLDYVEALQQLSELRPVIDSFFDEVMVNADDEAVKLNRQLLLKDLHTLFMQVADISLLQITGQ